MFTKLSILAILGGVFLTYLVELCLAPAQIRRLQYEHADWMAKCLEWSRKGWDPEAQLAARQVEQLRRDIDFLRSMLRPWQRARHLLTLLAGFFLVGCSGADFEASSGSPPVELPDATPVVRSRLPQDALAPAPDADAGVTPPEGTGGRPGAGGATATGGAPVQPGTGGATVVLGSGGSVSTGGSTVSGTGGSPPVSGTGGSPPVRTSAEVLQSLNRPDCMVDSLTVDCSPWRPTVDVHPVGIRCSASPPIPLTAPGCHQAGPVGNLWCCLP